MTGILAKDTRVLLNAYDLSAFLSEVSEDSEFEPLDGTTFTSGGQRSWEAGLMSGEIDLSGFYDGSDDAAHEALSSALGSSDVLASIALEGFALGLPVMLVHALESLYGVKATVGQLIACRAKLMASEIEGGSIDLGVSLHDRAQIFATENGASVNNAAPSTNGGVAILHVPQFNGTNATVKVQHSADNAIWVDLLTFTAVTAKTSERKIVAAGATVNQYLRYATSAGTFTSLTPIVSFARR